MGRGFGEDVEHTVVRERVVAEIGDVGGTELEEG